MPLLLEDSGDLLLEGSGSLLLEDDAGPQEVSADFRAGAGMSCGAYITRRRGRRWLAVGSIALDEATEYVATGRTVHPSRTYEGRVLAWGSIEKSIPVPSGMPQASQLRCRLADTDDVWRDKLGGQTPQGRRVQIKFLQEGTSEAAADVLFTGVIEEFSTGAGYVEIYAVSDELTWLDEQIPDVITPENFPEYANVKQAFLPVIIGTVIGKAVALGVSNEPPAEPAAGALVDAADYVEANYTTAILAATFTTVTQLGFAQADWGNKVESKYAVGLSMIHDEFYFQYNSGVLELADAEYARTKLQDLLDATDAKATEFSAISSLHAGIIANFRSGVTSHFGANWSTILAGFDNAIATLEGSPPAQAFAPQGAVPLPRISETRWGAAMHELWNVLAIYRKNPDEAVFTPVDPGEYNVTVQARTFGEYPGATFNCTFIDFLVEQPDGTEIRMDADGAYARAAFGSMPAAGYAADGSLGPLRNPVDGFLILKELILPKSATAENSNIDALAALRNKLENGGTTIPPLKCDGAVTESITGRELMGRFLASFQADFFHDKRGKEKLVRIDDTDSTRPVVTEHVIVRNTWSEKSPNPTVNRYRSNYSRDYATDNWFEIALADNLSDQEARQKVQDATLDEWFVREAQTALATTQDRLRYTALASYRQRFEYPLPECSSFLELAKLIGVTHRRGMKISGYTNREVKIVGYSIDLDGFRVTIDTIVRSPLPFGQKHEVSADFSAGAEMEVQADASNPFEEFVRPATVTIVDGSRGGWIDEGNIIDGDPNTYGIYLLDRTTSLSQYRFCLLSDIPAPNPGRTLVSITMYLDWSYDDFGQSATDGCDPNLLEISGHSTPPALHDTAGTSYAEPSLSPGSFSQRTDSWDVPLGAYSGTPPPYVRIYAGTSLFFPTVLGPYWSPNLRWFFHDFRVRYLYSD